VPDEEELARVRAKQAAEAARKADEAKAAAGAEPAAAGQQATAVPVGGPLALQPVTLVFRDIRYFVPNPEADVKRAKGDGARRRWLPAPLLGAGCCRLEAAAAAAAERAPPAYAPPLTRPRCLAPCAQTRRRRPRAWSCSRASRATLSPAC
jgi:hypothetical protein